MRTLTFYGASDDLFEVDGATGKDEPDEIGCYNTPAAVKVSNDHAGLIVTGVYGVANGCWSIGLCQLDEDQPLPDWPMKWTTEKYSVRLTIEAPDSALVERLVPALEKDDD